MSESQHGKAPDLDSSSLQNAPQNDSAPRVVEIDGFDDVIMYALEFKRHASGKGECDSPLLTFSEIWTICDAAGHQMKFPLRDTVMDRKEFARKIFLDIEFLEDLNFTWRNPPKGYAKLVHIGLTERGKSWLNHVIFANQERLNKRLWPVWLGGEKPDAKR